MTAPAIKAALDAAALAMHRDLTGFQWLAAPPETHRAATAAVAAFLRRLCEADAAIIDRHGHDASIYVRGLERLAAAVERAAEVGE